MEIISAFKTSDGTIFYNEIEATDHETGLKVKNEIEVIVDEFFERKLTKKTLTENLMLNASKLVKVLSKIAQAETTPEIELINNQTESITNIDNTEQIEQIEQTKQPE